MRKKAEIIFFTEKIALFSKICVLNNLIVPKVEMLQLPKEMSIYIVDPYKLLPEVFHTR